MRIDDDRGTSNPLAPRLQGFARQFRQFDSSQRPVRIDPSLETGLDLVSLGVALAIADVLHITLAGNLHRDDLRTTTRAEVLEPGICGHLGRSEPIRRG